RVAAVPRATNEARRLMDHCRPGDECGEVSFGELDQFVIVDPACGDQGCASPTVMQVAPLAEICNRHRPDRRFLAEDRPSEALALEWRRAQFVEPHVAWAIA